MNIYIGILNICAVSFNLCRKHGCWDI